MSDYTMYRGIQGPILSDGPKRIAVQALAIKGFTLLELLVAMTLVAVVTLIAATAFRLTVQAWERGAEEGESRQIQSALPTLLDKQLAARIITPMFGQAQVKPDMYFCGGENSLSFMTAYAPQGSVSQGLLWVRYRFDPGQKRLLIYQHPLTRLEDLEIVSGRAGAKISDAGMPISQIQGISDFRLAYSSEPLYNPEDAGQWEKSWDCDPETNGVPNGLMLQMTIGEGSRSRRVTWIYRVGDQNASSPFGRR